MKAKLVIGLMIALSLCSCQNSKKDKDGKAVAKVYDKVLYQSDLQGVLYDGISTNDSIVKTKAFIDNWIRRQLIIHQAENTLDKSDIDFSKQLEEYRNDLIIHKYESMLIEQNLDTIVSDEEIAKYKENNALVGMDNASIRNIILYTRSQEIIGKMNNSLYNKAVKDKVFEIY